MIKDIITIVNRMRSPQSTVQKRTKKEERSNIPIIIGVCIAIVAILGVVLIVWIAKTNQSAPVPTQAPLAITPEGQRVQSQATKSELQQQSQPQQSLQQSEFKNVIVDGMGEAGKSVADWMDLIVLLIVLGFITSIFIKLGKDWR